ncbi:MAG TPA: hypothetical protein VK338_02795, partial [Candidatus Nitrosocosmicus sp.]|nr:hypothetical protein [Candidatus Nitrosocosmicus sp.]
KDNKINIKIKNGTSVALKNVSSDAYGEIFHFDSESLYFSVTEEDIKNKIICIEELKNHIQAKYNALGSIGFIYLKGDVSSSLPTAQFKTVDDYETIKKTKKKYIIFSVADKTAIVYD